MIHQKYFAIVAIIDSSSAFFQSKNVYLSLEYECHLLNFNAQASAKFIFSNPFC